MKCCSLKRHLLETHCKRMSILFYKLNGFNEPSLKHVFIASLPSELQLDLQRQLTATNLSIADISLGKIFQTAMLCLDKICEQKEFFKDLMADKKPFSEACKKPYLQIECKDEKKCFCPIKKKKHFHKKSSSKKPFRYFKKKDVSQYRKNNHNRCFICKKRGHFARNCPHNLPKLFVLFSISNILHCYLKMKMLNPTSLNSQAKMIKLLSFSQNLLILMIFQSFLQSKLSTKFHLFPGLLSKCQSFLQSFINLFLSSGL